MHTYVYIIPIERYTYRVSAALPAAARIASLTPLAPPCTHADSIYTYGGGVLPGVHQVQSFFFPKKNLPAGGYDLAVLG
jgi:hypothetical protein